MNNPMDDFDTGIDIPPTGAAWVVIAIAVIAFTFSGLVCGVVAAWMLIRLGV